MNLVDYVHVLRRRWKLIVAAVVLVAAIAFLTAPSSSGSGPVVNQAGYTATATLLQDPNARSAVNLPIVQLYIKTGTIPQAAAKALKYDGLPQLLANSVTVSGDPKTETITITATDPQGDRAAAIANAFAQATIDYLQQNQQQDTQKSIAALQKSLADLKNQIATLNAQIQAAGGSKTNNTDVSLMTAQRDGLLQQYQALFQRLTQLQSQPAEAAQLDILQKAVPIPIASSASSFSAPKSPLTRTGLGALIGLLLGIAGALIAERFDTRLRSRVAVERSFRLPVVSEIPRLRRRIGGRYAIAASAEPDGMPAEAFRTLRSALTLMPSVPLTVLEETPDGVLPPVRDASRPGQQQVIVVTAASSGVGKTTTAANLAACLAEAGKSVLLLDCDFRHPEAHLFFQVENRSGLSDVLAAGQFTGLASFVRPTPVVGVSMIPAGTASWMPTRLVQHIDTILVQARTLADVVIIDSPPLLGASEAADLAAVADSVVVAAWAGRTTTEHAERTVELLARVGAPALGVALVTNSATRSYASGTASQRGWPRNLVDHRGGRAAGRERSRSGGRGIRGHQG
jgi:capsular exopolysaccharide synthesis family protein